MIVRVIGSIFSITGIIIALYSRWLLGKEWSTIPSIKTDHQLITSGPYRYVRHPIYSGMLIALLGSSLLYGNLWLAALVLFTIVFYFKKTVEEELLINKFQEKYLQYMKHTKSFIPFIY